MTHRRPQGSGPGGLRELFRSSLPWRTAIDVLTSTVMSGFIIVLLAAAVAFQVWVTWRVWRSDLFQRNQKVAQSQLIWILPVLGAIIVHSVLSEEDRQDRGSGSGTLMS